MARLPHRIWQDEARGGFGLGTRIAYGWKSNLWGIVFWAFIIYLGTR